MALESPIPKYMVDKIVDAIVRDIEGRGGISDEWEQIDDDTLRDIKRAWKAIIIKETCR